jgi:histidine ammonia-lyase
MTGIAAINNINAHKLIETAITHTAILYEIVEAHVECIEDIVFEVRPHPGQKHVIQKLQGLLSSSTRVHKRTNYPTPDAIEHTAELQSIPQEIYSLRCAPQILGPIYDTIMGAEKIIDIELNAITDNPLISASGGTFHNGNFHGDYISLEMDKCRIAITKLSLLLERQLSFLLNPKQNGILPPFSNGGTVGLNLGLQAAQFVATSTAAENQTLATPISTHTISTNNDNQDIVSMGTNSSLLTSRVIDNTFQIQSILCATVAQSIEVLAIQNQIPDSLQTHYTQVRNIFPFISDDINFSRKMEALCTHLKK